MNECGSSKRGNSVTVLNWIERTTELARTGAKRQRQASSVECELLTRQLGIPACKALSVIYTLKPLDGARFRLSGEVRSVIVQICVVTLEEFEQQIVEPVNTEFWPVDQIIGRDDVTFDPLSEDDPEPIRNGKMEVGLLIYEVLAGALDPFPRQLGSELERTSSGVRPNQPKNSPGGTSPEPTIDEDKQHPFAVLASLHTQVTGKPSADDD